MAEALASGGTYGRIASCQVGNLSGTRSPKIEGDSSWNFGFFYDGGTTHVTEMRHSLGAIGAI